MVEPMPRPTLRRAALFDMDRTLIRVETASLYVKYQREIGEADAVDLARVVWWVLLYTFNMIDAPRVATKALSKLAGSWETVLAARCDDWMQRDVIPHLCEGGRVAVESHRARGDLLAIATGATIYSARPLARLLRIDHIVATELEVVEGMLTGRVVPPLTYGTGKLLRAQALLDQHGVRLRDTTFYTDSITDLPLLEAVGNPIAVNPDPQLRRIAVKRGWRIQRW